MSERSKDVTRYLLCYLVVFAVMVGYVDHNGASASAAEAAAETEGATQSIGVESPNNIVDEAEAYQPIGEPQKEIAYNGYCRQDSVTTQNVHIEKTYYDCNNNEMKYDVMLWSWNFRGPVHQWLMS